LDISRDLRSFVIRFDFKSYASLIVHIGANYNVEMPGFTYMLRPRKVTSGVRKINHPRLLPCVSYVTAGSSLCLNSGMARCATESLHSVINVNVNLYSAFS